MVMTEGDTPITHIVVCGGGLAASMTVALLSRHLPATIRITWVAEDDDPVADIFYGSVTAPSAYDFNLSAGVSEPQLVLDTDTAFCLGTQYLDWGREGRNWVQGFQLPLPILGGVLFHQYLIRQGLPDLEPYLVSAAAAKGGAFAHPPESAGHPLSRAEYGYQLDAAAYGRAFAAAIDMSRIVSIRTRVSDVEGDANGITALRLSDGQVVSADLFVDCTGPEAALLSRLSVEQPAGRRLGAALTRTSSDTLGPAVRTVTGHGFGWQSLTSLQGASTRLTVFAEAEADSALAAHGGTPDVSASAFFGRRAEAWVGNCVAIGQAAATVEPLTPAPLMLLQGDVKRLISLIPLSSDMAMERREFNRQFGNDYDHAELFRRAMFAVAPRDGSSYWLDIAVEPAGPRLDRKIAQFLSRGVLVAYDLEPFTPEDWVILHYGLGRQPQRSDRLADQASQDQLQQYLADMRRDIAAAVESLPSHHIYMSKLKRFLTQKGA